MSMDIYSLQKEFQKHSDSLQAAAMAAYMKGHFPYHGIRSPERRKIQAPYIKHWFKEHGLNWEIIWALFELPEREYQYVAVDYLNRCKRLFQVEDLEQIKRSILLKSWWDTVDLIASTALGEYMITFPASINELDKWNTSDNLWTVRSSILYQLKYKEAVDFKRLKRYVLQHQSSKEFFINKASGWALRQYAKVEPEEVKSFLKEYKLPSLTVKEASKHLN